MESLWAALGRAEKTGKKNIKKIPQSGNVDSQIFAYRTFAFRTFANHLLPIGYLPFGTVAKNFDSQICAYQTGAFCTFANHLVPIGHLPIKILAYQTFANQEFSNKTFAHPDNCTKLKSFAAINNCFMKENFCMKFIMMILHHEKYSDVDKMG